MLIEAFGSFFGLLGTLMLALKRPWSGWAFAVYLVSNVCWLIFGYSNNHWFFFAQQIGFLVTSLIGLWVWVIDPLLGRLFREGTWR